VDDLGRAVCLNTANHSKSPQIRPQTTAIHRKSGSSDFKDVETDRKSV